jgi:hypothetical protein
MVSESSKVENAVDLPDQMIGWHYLVEIKGIKKLALSAFPPTHHEPLPPMPVSIPTESSFASRLNGSFATQSSGQLTQVLRSFRRSYLR